MNVLRERAEPAGIFVPVPHPGPTFSLAFSGVRIYLVLTPAEQAELHTTGRVTKQMLAYNEDLNERQHVGYQLPTGGLVLDDEFPVVVTEAALSPVTLALMWRLYPDVYGWPE